MFRFKQFTVDQTGCAMKINTDGVLLGAMATVDEPTTILDIGTGTGVIALMLAQKYPDAKIGAVEVDRDAAQTAAKNFAASTFADRLTAYPLGFESYFNQYPEQKYDLIVSNPPFYIDSLKSPGAGKALAKHADPDFFERLIGSMASHLSDTGSCWLVLPVSLTNSITDIARQLRLFEAEIIKIRSYPSSLPHRDILHLSFALAAPQAADLSIYQAKDIYTQEYRKLLQPYFLAF